MIQTYNNKNIMANARILTGFVYTARRGNVDDFFRSNKSRMDPMRIEIDSHDFFPKPSIDGNWIGDRYPLCVNLPQRHFLKIGATFRFRGGSGLPQSHYLPTHWDKDESIRRFVLSPESSLYQQLSTLTKKALVGFVTPYLSTRIYLVTGESVELMKSSSSKSLLVLSTNILDSRVCISRFTMMQRR